MSDNYTFTPSRKEISGVHVPIEAIRCSGNPMAMRSSGMAAVDSSQKPSSLSIYNLGTLMDQLSSMIRTLEILRVESVLVSLCGWPR